MPDSAHSAKGGLPGPGGIGAAWHNSPVRPSVRVAMTLEQCWHEVPGGTAAAALGMARALVTEGVDVVGVAARHRRPAPSQWAPPVEVRQLPLPRIALYESWHRLRRPPVQRATGPVDVIHATALAIPPRSAPLVVTIHDVAFVHEPGHFTAHGMSFFRRGLEFARRDADLVLCSSRATMADLEAAGFAPAVLRHVPLGVDARSVPPERVGEVLGRYGIEHPYVLFVGTVEPRKNLRRLLEAWAELNPDAELVLVGPKGWKEDLGALIRGAGARVSALGFVPAADLHGLYAGARALCMPSLREGFGFPVLEAMAQGTPVVTSRGTSTEELAAGAGVLVDPYDAASIAHGLHEVLSDTELAGRLAGLGRERAGQYTWARTADLVSEAYREVAGAHAGGP